PDFIKMGGNYFRITSRMTVGEAFSRIGLPAPAHSVAQKPLISFVIDYFGKMPEEEESFSYGGAELTVDEIKDHRLTQIVIHILDDEEVEAT
ncbi:MAG: hypothetical protein IKZ16_01400, partial [Clostridia bacterium]|nr:hypothetical protein [Clostridia bacterium]